MGDCGQVRWHANNTGTVGGERDTIATPARTTVAPTEEARTRSPRVVNPRYSLLGERLRYVTPSALQCSMFCGGRMCKYCNPVAKFKPEDMVIHGLYSAWVTDKILATSRPSTEAIKRFNIIKQFQSSGITSIMNLQYVGEHSSCGYPLEPSGFSYIPETFMDNNIFFYNFEWNDYGVRSLQAILDMVQVLDFAVTDGKAAVHCHAGLGRTGVLIACYIIFAERLSANEAIHKVRKSRPRSIQTREQINCVKDFSAYIRPMWIIFSQPDVALDLPHFLQRQMKILHGEERQKLRCIPKLVFTVLTRLLQLCNVDYDLTPCVKVKFSMRKRPLETSQPISVPPETDPDGEITNSRDPTSGAANLLKLTEEDLFCLQRQNTDIPIASKSNKSEIVLVPPASPEFTSLDVDARKKSNSLPNVSFVSTTEETELRSARAVLKPLRHKMMMTELGERVESYQGNPDSCASLILSLNSWAGQSFNLAASLDTTIGSFSRSNSSVSGDANSMLSKSMNSGFSSVFGPGEEVVKSLAFRSSDAQALNQIDCYKHKLNTEPSAWEELSSETNITVLCGLLWSWIKHLKGPIAGIDVTDQLKVLIENPTNASELVPRNVWTLMDCFITCLSKLGGRPDDIIRAVRRFSVLLSEDDTIPRLKFYKPQLEKELTGKETHGYILFKFLLAKLYALKDVT